MKWLSFVKVFGQMKIQNHLSKYITGMYIITQESTSNNVIIFSPLGYS